MSSTISSTNTPPNFNDSIILVLEPTNDTFSTKRICLSDNTPVKIGRITNKNTHQTQTNGYFDSRVLSRTHAEIWKDNGKVFVRDLKSSNGTFVNGKRISIEDKEGDPVELKNHDLLEFGIDIYNEHDRKLLYRKIATTVQITSSSNARSRIGVIKNGSSCKRRSGPTPGVHSPDDSIYASLEFELHNARDESRRLIELNNVLNDIGNTLENRNNRDKSDENVVIHPDFKEPQTKFRAHVLNCDFEKDAMVAELNRKLEHEICLHNEHKEKSQMYEKKIQQLEENLKATLPKNLESDSKLIEELKNQLNELVSKFESLRLLHVSEVDELKYKIQKVNTELENTSRELSDLQDLYSSDTEKYEKRINGLLKQLDDTRDEGDATKKIYEQSNILSEFNELMSRYKQIIIEREVSISKLNEEHTGATSFKDQREKDISNQFIDFKKEAQNTLNTIQQQLIDTHEEIMSVVNKNNNLIVVNCEYLEKTDIPKTCLKDYNIEQIRAENERLKEENSKIKAELKRWNKEESAKIDQNVKVELSNHLSGESSQAVIHQKQKTTVKEFEWTKESDSLLLMENHITVLFISFISLTFFSYLFESGILNVIFIGFGTYSLLNLP